MGVHKVVGEGEAGSLREGVGKERGEPGGGREDEKR